MTKDLIPKVRLKIRDCTIQISAKVDDQFVQDIPEFLATNAKGVCYMGKRIWKENRACYFLVAYRGRLYRLSDFSKRFGRYVLTLTKCPFSASDTALIAEYKYCVECTTSEFHQDFFSWYFKESEKEIAQETFKGLGGEDSAVLKTIVV